MGNVVALDFKRVPLGQRLERRHAEQRRESHWLTFPFRRMPPMIPNPLHGLHRPLGDPSITTDLEIHVQTSVLDGSNRHIRNARAQFVRRGRPA